MLLCSQVIHGCNTPVLNRDSSVHHSAIQSIKSPRSWRSFSPCIGKVCVRAYVSSLTGTHRCIPSCVEKDSPRK